MKSTSACRANWHRKLFVKVSNRRFSEMRSCDYARAVVSIKRKRKDLHGKLDGIPCRS